MDEQRVRAQWPTRSLFAVVLVGLGSRSPGSHGYVRPAIDDTSHVTTEWRKLRVAVAAPRDGIDMAECSSLL